MTAQPLKTKSVDEATKESPLFDVGSLKKQMFYGGLLIVAACFLNYLPSLHVGLLLDDFNNIDYVFRAAHGDTHDFLINFYSNWAKLDVMKSYRPMISLSFFTDYLIWGLKYYGYHITNIFVFAACAILVSMIALELTGMYGNRARASVAIWAGLLFAVYPLHVESVSWIIGRVDLYCSMFYYASVWLFLRFRLTRERNDLILSLICFFFALTSKEMAVTLPVVQVLATMLPIRTGKDARSPLVHRIIASDLKYALLFFLELGGFFVMRTAFLGATIGGYGSTDTGTVLNSWRNFIDRSTIYKILVPANEELHLNDNCLKVSLIGSAVLAVSAALRLMLSRRLILILAFLFTWCALAILPTFQIWHIFPNLVGSRLFFTSSGPFCIALAMCAVPCADAFAKRTVQVYSVVGALALLLLYFNWSWILQEDLKPWLTAAKHMEAFQKKIQQIEHRKSERALLLNLPPDYEGAGMVTRAWYLQQICRPPFTDKDVAETFVSIEPVVAGSHEFLWPGELVSLISGAKGVVDSYIWDSHDGKFVQWTHLDLGSRKIVTLNHFLGAIIDPPTAWSGRSNEWHLQSDEQPGVEQYPNFRRLYPAKASPPHTKKAPPTMTIWFPVSSPNPLTPKATNEVNPLNQNFARINLRLHSGDMSKIRLVWKSIGLNPPGQLEHEATILGNEKDGYFVWLGRYRSWSLNDAPFVVGLRLSPGEYCVDLKDIQLLSDADMKPTLLFNSEPALPGTPVYPKWNSTDEKLYPTPGTDQATQGNPITGNITWNAKLPNCASVLVKISKPNLTFDANDEGYILTPPQGNVAKEISKDGTTGSLSASDLNLQPGTTQVQVIALDKSGKQIGLPSEPLSLKIEQ